MRGDLDWIVMKALEKDRTRRYETANGFAADLLRYLADEPVTACPPTIGYRLRKSARRNKVALATSGVVALALLAGTVASTWQAIRARQAELDATTQRNIAQAQRQFARQAVDKMFTQVAEKWLSRNTSLEPVQKQILVDALQIYEELAREEGADPALRLERGNAYRRIGEINFKLGNLAESERAFRKAQEILGSLVDQQASEPDYRSALASAWHQYGFVLHYSARMEDALDAYRQALLHRERLEADHPGIPRYTREMAVSLGGVANMLDSLGSFPEAEAAYLRAIHLMESLPGEVADEPDCRYELGLLYSELAGAQDAQGRGRESLPLFYRGKAVYEQLVTEFPRDPTYREELAWALRQEATRLADRPDDAEKLYRRSLAISLQLSQESPTVPGHQSGVGQRYYDLGSLLVRSGRRAEAEDAFRQAARIAEQVLSDFPDWSPPDFGGSFAGCHSALQTLLLKDGRRQEAEAIYHRAVEVYPQLSKRWMKSPTNRWLLAEFRWGLAKLACKYHRREDAARFSGEALLLYEQAAAELPRQLAYQQVLAARKAELVNVSTCAEPARETNQ
jgi:tetratricopeptide (TPR) repeat protein